MHKTTNSWKTIKLVLGNHFFIMSQEKKLLLNDCNCLAVALFAVNNMFLTVIFSRNFCVPVLVIGTF